MTNNQSDLLKPAFLNTNYGQKLAYVKDNPINDIAAKSGKTCVWLGGYHSDFLGGKASVMRNTAIKNNVSSLLFDYSGHGQSSGEFADFCLSDWLRDVEAIVDNTTSGDLMLVGSSMGGWLSLLYALKHPERVKRLVLIAPAPDFTEDLMWQGMGAAAQKEVIENGYWVLASEFDAGGYKITRKLIEDGRNHLILHKEIKINVPVTIIQGMQDESVPYERALELAQNLSTPEVKLIYIKDGDHRLSRDNDLVQIEKLIDENLKTF